ncbi:Ubiquitin-conjugating enzyme E2 32 [Apostasia shenzhenica]|uniref:Ubiquitin-conjugating enzyme E2 32 n=1 Tax=Apostasia shenzhenica TaxID=1088818 RepID=A0A2I0AGJ7_9ASPA|nr:Ubiquitin-conjugating enzyme E2 32 [Apostasia shenzhenica]
MAEEKFNRKNTAVKRILQEVKEMQSIPSDDFMSLPLEENIFEWQFAILGPRDSEFEGGIYHGRIQLPSEYPFKPPSFLLLTPNGRFETQTKICLSISNHHPEHWQPSWSVRTALVALIAFMPTNPGGALGSLDYPKEERRRLAIKSREAAPVFGNSERQTMINEIHQYMLSKVPPVPQLPSSTITVGQTNSNASEDPQQINTTNNESPSTGDLAPNPEAEERAADDAHEVRVDAAAGRLHVSFRAEAAVSRDARPEANSTTVRAQKPTDDRFLTLAAIGLTVAIAILLVKKFLKSNGLAGFLDEL